MLLLTLLFTKLFTLMACANNCGGAIVEDDGCWALVGVPPFPVFIPEVDRPDAEKVACWVWIINELVLLFPAETPRDDGVSRFFNLTPARFVGLSPPYNQLMRRKVMSAQEKVLNACKGLRRSCIR